MKVISNTTVISNFSAIGQIDLLRQLYHELYITVEVHREIRAGLEEGYKYYSDVEKLIYPGTKSGWIRLTGLVEERELEIFAETPTSLHPGEATSLAVASNRKWLFLTDDKAARKRAKEYGVLISGTLGCLAAGVERSLWSVEQANEWLKRIVALGFYSPIANIEDLIEKAS